MAQGPKIAIAGAGSIGCYVGGCLALAGREVRLLARPRIVEAAAQGLRMTDYEGRDRTVSMAATQEPADALADADIILVTVKSGQTLEMAELIEQHAPQHAIIVSLQNGVENAERIAAATLKSRRTVVPGMVPFNVVQSDNGKPRFHRGTEGAVMVRQGHGLGAVLGVDGLPAKEAEDMNAVLWGKLLLNLNNALNALSGLPLAEQISDREWRRLLADQMDEALAAMAAGRIRAAALSGVSPSLVPTILRLPNWLFKRVARRMLTIDPEARSSMWEDLQRRRRTEIDEFQGAVQRLGYVHNVKTPLSRLIAELVREAEGAGTGSPELKPHHLRL